MIKVIKIYNVKFDEKNLLNTTDVKRHFQIQFCEWTSGQSSSDGSVVELKNPLSAESADSHAVPDVPTNWIRRGDVRDATSEIESEFQLAVDQVQADKVTFAVVQLAVVKQKTVVRAREEPQFDGEGLRDTFQAR